MSWSVWLIIIVIWTVAIYIERRSHRKLLKAMTQSRDEWKQIAEQGVDTLTESNNQLVAARMELDDLRAFRDSMQRDEVRIPSMPENAREEIRNALRTGRTGLVSMERDIANHNFTITLSDGRRFTVDQTEIQGLQPRPRRFEHDVRVNVVDEPGEPTVPAMVRQRLAEAVQEAVRRNPGLMTSRLLRAGGQALPVDPTAQIVKMPSDPLPPREGKRKITIPGVQPPARKK